MSCSTTSRPSTRADNGYTIYLGTQCTDEPWPRDQAELNPDNWRLDNTYNHFTWSNAWFNGPCAYWPFKAGTPVTVEDTGVHLPILLIDETNDAARPYPGSRYVRQLLPTAPLIAGKVGSTHAGSPSGLACTDDSIAAYLQNGTVPTRLSGNRSDKVCPPVPQPDPTAPGAARTGAHRGGRWRCCTTPSRWPSTIDAAPFCAWALRPVPGTRQNAGARSHRRAPGREQGPSPMTSHRFTSRRALTAATLALATTALGTVLLTTASDSSAAPTGAPAAGSKYVALGDSYAAGYGIGTSTGEPVPGCAQSTQDYPHQIATALKLDLTDVSCSGAVTANIDTTPQATPAGTAPLQDTALSSSTDLVTVTIGGNDLGFSDISTYCLAGRATGPLALHPAFQNCKAHYAPDGGPDSLATRVKNVVIPAVNRVLDDIHAKAPNAAVYFIDYPAISTSKDGSPDPSTYPNSCFLSVLNPESFPFTGVDTEYLQTVQANLNDALSAAVDKSGDAFVEDYPQSLPHSACVGTVDPWMNGITIDLATGGPGPGSLHPNLEGATQMANDALDAIRAVAPPTSSAPATSPTPEPSTSAASASPQPSASSSSGGLLADTGAAVRQPVLVGLLMLMAGSGLLVAVRRRQSGSHRR